MNGLLRKVFSSSRDVLLIIAFLLAVVLLVFAVQDGHVASFKDSTISIPGSRGFYSILPLDEHTIVAGCGDGFVRAIDLGTHRGSVFVNAGDRVNALAIDSAFNRLAVGCDNGEVQIYDMGTKTCIARFTREPAQPIWDLDWSPSGRYLAIASERPEVEVWDSKHQKVTASLDTKAMAVWTAKFNGCDEQVAAGDHDGRYTLFNVADNSKATSTRLFEGNLNSLVVVAKDNVLACGESEVVSARGFPSAFMRTRVMDQENTPILDVKSISASEEGELYGVGSIHGWVWLWNTAKQRVVLCAQPHHASVTGTAFVGRELFVASFSGSTADDKKWDGEVIMWKVSR